MPFEIVDVRSRLALLREISYLGSSAEVETELTVELVEYCRRREAQGGGSESSFGNVHC